MKGKFKTKMENKTDTLTRHSLGHSAPTNPVTLTESHSQHAKIAVKVTNILHCMKTNKNEKEKLQWRLLLKMHQKQGPQKLLFEILAEPVINHNSLTCVIGRCH